MQLQILFTDDTAWMNLIDSRIGKTIPVLMAKQPSVPLYFIMDNGEILAGPLARRWYFDSCAKLDQLGELYFGNLLEYIRSEKTFSYKGEERSGAYLVTWLYDYANEFIHKNTSSDEIDEIAITALPAWEEDDLTKLKEQLDTCRPTKIIPLSTFFVDAEYVALPVAREFQLGKFENNQWKMFYKSPMFDADMRIRSMAKRMVDNVCHEFELSNEQKSVEIRSCEAYLKEKNVLSIIESGERFKGNYKGVSELGLNEISVSFERKSALIPDDQRTFSAVASSIILKLQNSECDQGIIEFVGDGYCIPEFQKEFKEKLVAYNLQFVPTAVFFKNIFAREWSERNNVSVVIAASTAIVKSVQSLAISNLLPNDIVYLHGADNGKEDSKKELRYLGNNRFETIKNTRKWCQPHDTLTAQDLVWCVGQKVRLKLERTGQVATTRTLVEIKAPVRETKTAQAPAAPKASSPCASAFEVAGSAGIEKNVSLNEIDISSLNVGDVVSLHGVDPNGVKAPTRKELRYLGNARFETIENTRGWSHPGDVIVAKDFIWELRQNLRFMLERTGQVASTRMIDSMQVK